MSSEARPTITSVRGAQLPNPAALGFKWKPAQKLLEQHAGLRQQMREAARERVALQSEIRELEKDHARRRAEALRAGKEVTSRAEIEKAKARYEALGEREKDLRRAGEMVDADLYRVVGAHWEEWDAEVVEEAEQLLEEARQAADVLREKLYRADLLAAFHEWLEAKGERFAPGTGSDVPVEGLIEQRRKALGLIRSEAIISSEAFA